MLIQRPVHQSFGLVKCTVGMDGLAKNGVFGSHLGSCDLIHWILLSFYCSDIIIGKTFMICNYKTNKLGL